MMLLRYRTIQDRVSFRQLALQMILQTQTITCSDLSKIMQPVAKSLSSVAATAWSSEDPGQNNVVCTKTN